MYSLIEDFKLVSDLHSAIQGMEWSDIMVKLQTSLQQEQERDKQKTGEGKTPITDRQGRFPHSCHVTSLLSYCLSEAEEARDSG